MPDIGLVELALIGLIGFLVLGPERLPDFMAQVAKVVRQGRGWIASLKTQLDREKQQLVKPAEVIKESVQAAVEDTNQTTKVKK